MRNRFSALLYLLLFPVLWCGYFFLLLVSLFDFAALYSLVRHESNKYGKVSGVLMDDLIRSKDLVKFYFCGSIGVGFILALAQVFTGKSLIRGWI